MDGDAGVHNATDGVVRGTVVQAGSIQQVALGGYLGPEPSSSGPPRQLPLAIRDFTGRAEYVVAMDALLPGAAAGAVAETVVISAVDGAAGIGKTTLAVWWAHRVENRFPDGTLYVNLRGYGPGAPAVAGEVLEGFLRALGVPAGAVPRGVEAQAASFRSLLAGRRVLVVLDNANSEQQVRPLLPGAPGCVVVVTSRDSLTGLVVTEGARRFTLDLLTEAESAQLVCGIVGASRVVAEQDAVAELVRLCARLPLALRVAAGRAVGPHASVSDVVVELADDRFRLDALSRSGDERAAVRAVFDWSYQRLDPEQARLFRCLGLHPGPEIGVYAAAAVAGLELDEARRRMDTFVDAHLIELVGRGRYRFHDLLRAYAVDRAQDMTDEERTQATERVLGWYAWHAIVAHRTLFAAMASWNPLLDSVERACPEMKVSVSQDAWTWFDAETINLDAAVRTADRHRLHRLTIPLAYVAGRRLVHRGDWKSRLTIVMLGLSAAHSRGDRVAEYHALVDAGLVHTDAGQWREATSSCLAALSLARDLDDPWRQAAPLNDLGLVCVRQGLYSQALAYLEAARPMSVGAQNGRLEGVIEDNISAAQIGLGEYAAALDHAERGLRLRRHSGDLEAESFSLRHMAAAKQGMGKDLEAVGYCEQALASVQPYYLGVVNTAEVLVTMGISLSRLGDAERALACWREALAIYERFGDYRAAEVKHRLHALAVDDGA